ncbi:MAG: hypothetical protein EOM55_05305, partial [Clostridia bacterium]|nr:hypothetical protein [Clostridia bacterium]
NTGRYGGGLGLYSCSIVGLTDCNFIDNSANLNSPGGGLFSEIVTDITLLRCTFSQNTSEGAGGAINFVTTQNITLISCVVDNNDYINGASDGIYINYSATETINVKGCRFINQSEGIALNASCSTIGNYLITKATSEDDDQIATGEEVWTTFSNNARAGSFSNGNWTLEYLNVENNAGENSGTFYVGTAESLIVRHSVFKDNTQSHGGALLVENVKNVTVGEDDGDGETSDVTFSTNSATNVGGAVHLTGIILSASFVDCLFESNFAKNDVAGAFYCTTGTVELTFRNSTFTGNSAYSSGGAIRSNSQKTTITSTNGTKENGCIFEGNIAQGGGGGAICITSLDCVIEYSTFSENYSSNYGGAIYYSKTGGSFEMSNCDITSNESKYFGGGVFVTSATTVKISSCDIYLNSAKHRGSGISVEYCKELEMNDCTLNGNVITSANSGAYL